MPALLQLQKIPGKGDGGWKKVSLRRFLADQKNAFWGILLHEQQVIACCQIHSDYGPPKMPLKLAVKNSQIHCHRLPLWRKYAPEVKAAKWLKRCRTNVKGVNNPAWTAQYWHAVDAKLCNTSLSFMLHFLIVYATFPFRVCYISLSCMLHVLAVYATLRNITVSFMIHENNALTCMQYCLLMHDVLIACHVCNIAFWCMMF